MIRHVDHFIYIEINLARALVKFTEKKSAKQLGVGVDELGVVCATDGFTAMRCIAWVVNLAWRGTWWSREYVETAIKVAAAKNLAEIVLDVQECQTGFPFINQCIPGTLKVSPEGASFNPAFLARMETITKALSVKTMNLVALDPIGPSIWHGMRHGKVEIEAIIMPAVM